MNETAALEKAGFTVKGGRAEKKIDDGHTLYKIIGKNGLMIDVGNQQYRFTEEKDEEIKRYCLEVSEQVWKLMREADDIQEASFEEVEQPPGEVPQEEKSKTEWKKPEPRRAQVPAVRQPPASMMQKQVEDLDLGAIKTYICPKATDQEAFMFLQLCQARNLNPFTKEAYLVKYGQDATMIVGKDAFTRRAEEHPNFDGFKAGVIVQNGNPEIEYREGTFLKDGEKILGGWAEIYRKDRTHPFKATVSMAEYASGTATWKKMPGTMIRKVALVQALREAFPSEFSGMYDGSEMGVEV